MNVILIQLPLQSHDFFFSNENIPLAAASLQAISVRQDINVRLVPRHLMSYGSDQAILQFLITAHPDLLGMSCYEWNIERSLFLARRIKESLPHCRVVLGGPEITPDNEFLLAHNDFDVGVVGEGEPIWQELLRWHPHTPKMPGLLVRGEDGKWDITEQGPECVPMRSLPSPYLSGCLDDYATKVLWLETVRGCVHRCAYCYYHKQAPRLRLAPRERIVAEVRRAMDHGIEEIVFLDPCFARRPRLEALLDALSGLNEGRTLVFHAECNAETIDSGLARRISRAGFHQMEIGLQSTHPATLRQIHRRFNPPRFLEGVAQLRNHGIKVMVDVIAGLPGDSLDDVCRTLDWVLENESYDFLMLYPLGLLPATELQRRSSELRLSAMSYPPYFITRSQEMDAAEICKAFRYYEECMDEDICPPEMPTALTPGAGKISLPDGLKNVIGWQNLEHVRSLSDVWNHTTYGVTVHFSAKVLRRPELWVRHLEAYLEQNPFTLLSAAVPPDSFPEDLKPLWLLAEGHHHLIDRDYTVTHTPYRSVLVFSRAHGVIWKWPDPREWNPVALSDSQKVSYPPTCLVASPPKTSLKWLIDHLAKRYPILPEIRVWEPPGDSE